MPRTAIDYSKTVIYKIVCKDLNIKDCYVGHTTDFASRKSGHKHHCSKETSQKHNLKIYQTIREKGGWDNWQMIEIEKFPCKDSNEACTRERFHYEQLNASMNTLRPISSDAEKLEQSRNYDKKRRESEEYRNRKNEKRRELYNTDEEYRNQINEKNKQNHAKRKLLAATADTNTTERQL